LSSFWGTCRKDARVVAEAISRIKAKHQNQIAEIHELQGKIENGNAITGTGKIVDTVGYLIIFTPKHDSQNELN